MIFTAYIKHVPVLIAFSGNTLVLVLRAQQVSVALKQLVLC